MHRKVDLLVFVFLFMHTADPKANSPFLTRL